MRQKTDEGAAHETKLEGTPCQTEFEWPWASKRHWIVQPDRGAPQQPITLDLTLQSTRETKAQITIYANGTLTGKLAKAVKANTDSPSRFTAFATAKALFRRTTTDPPPNRSRTAIK